jgi:hypothetical protein
MLSCPGLIAASFAGVDVFGYRKRALFILDIRDIFAKRSRYSVTLLDEINSGNLVSCCIHSDKAQSPILPTLRREVQIRLATVFCATNTNPLKSDVLSAGSSTQISLAIFVGK